MIKVFRLYPPDRKSTEQGFFMDFESAKLSVPSDYSEMLHGLAEDPDSWLIEEYHVPEFNNPAFFPTSFNDGGKRYLDRSRIQNIFSFKKP
jgi:hypothetical protein